MDALREGMAGADSKVGDRLPSSQLYALLISVLIRIYILVRAVVESLLLPLRNEAVAGFILGF